MVLMNQARLDSLRLVLFADVLGLIDAILEFDATSRNNEVGPLQPICPEPTLRVLRLVVLNS